MALSCVSQKKGMLGRLALVTGGQKLSVKPRVSPGEGQGLKALPWWSPFTRTCAFLEVGTEKKKFPSFQFSLLSFRHEEDAVGPGEYGSAEKGLATKVLGLEFESKAHMKVKWCGCLSVVLEAGTGHPCGQAGWLDQQSQGALEFSKTPFLSEECGSYQERHSVHPQPSPTSKNMYVHIHGLPHVQIHMQTYMLTMCTCQKGVRHSRNNMERAEKRS